MRALSVVRVSVALVMALAVIPFGGSAGADDEGATVEMRGLLSIEINKNFQATFQFHPDDVKVASGGTVTWVNESGPPIEATHTITIANKAELPKGIEEIFECGSSPDDACSPARGHESDPPTLVLNKGKPGLDTKGDSLLLLPGEKISAKVSAPAGTTLFYLCVIHPWLQASIDVE